jgi:hypothetical protein
MKRQINTGRAVKKSGAKGKQKVMIFAAIEIYRDNSERARYDACKYLPHQNEREMQRRIRQQKAANG